MLAFNKFQYTLDQIVISHECGFFRAAPIKSNALAMRGDETQACDWPEVTWLHKRILLVLLFVTAAFGSV